MTMFLIEQIAHPTCHRVHMCLLMHILSFFVSRVARNLENLVLLGCPERSASLAYFACLLGCDSWTRPPRVTCQKRSTVAEDFSEPLGAKNFKKRKNNP